MWSLADLLALVTTFTLLASARSFVTVRVEINPSLPSSSTVACSSDFIYNLESNLTEFVLNATQTISFLYDFNIPSGLHLAYFQNSTRRALRALAVAKAKTTKTTISTCSSAGCSVSVGIGLCTFCGSSRRRTETLTIKDEVSEPATDRMLAADWTQVGIDVTLDVQPLVRGYVMATVGANGCLGDPTKLAVIVTFLSNLPFSPTMEASLIQAFGAISPPAAAPTSQACCTQDFKNCVSTCGATQLQCQACNATGAVWLPQGPPSSLSTCIPRGSSCLNNSAACCAGLVCVGDATQQQCLYAAASVSLAPAISSTQAPTKSTTKSPSMSPSQSSTNAPTQIPTSFPTMLPTPIPTKLPTPIPTKLPTSSPTVLPTALPTALPTLLPTSLPTKLPTISPTKQPTILPTKLPTPFPTPKPTAARFPAGRISVGSDGTIAAVDINGNLFISSNGAAWSQLRTGVKDVAVVSRSSIYIVGRDANVYRLNGNNWNQIGVYSSFIATASDATVAVVNSQVGTIWVKVNYDDNPNWTMVPGVYGATRVAVVSKSSIYFLKADGSVYRSDRTNPPVRVGRWSEEISASSDGTVVVVGTTQQLWQKTYDNNVEQWFQLSGSATIIAVQNKNVKFFIDTAGAVQRSP